MSVTFRDLSLEGVVAAAVAAGLEKISWSADVHVPPGDFTQADAARSLCAASSVGVEGYASYWRADESPFAQILNTAVRLGAPRIRIWAGDKGSGASSCAERTRVAGNIGAAADLAAAQGVELHLEFHVETLTDSADSTLALLADIEAMRSVRALPVRSYWQPRPGILDAMALEELSLLHGHLAGLHVFSWDGASTRLPLKTHRGSWLSRLRQLAHAGPANIDLLLEFVAGQSPEQLRQDARELRYWIGQIGTSVTNSADDGPAENAGTTQAVH